MDAHLVVTAAIKQIAIVQYVSDKWYNVKYNDIVIDVDVDLSAFKLHDLRRVLLALIIAAPLDEPTYDIIIHLLEIALAHVNACIDELGTELVNYDDLVVRINELRIENKKLMTAVTALSS